VTIARPNPPATSPSALHAALEDVFRRGDVDAFLELHEPDASVRVPPNGEIAHGPEEIRRATAPLLSMCPHLTSSVLGILEGDGLALSHARWSLRVAPKGADLVELQGRGTIVSRRRPDGTWGILFDDPMTPV